ncbi:MAG TPA: hypothetical protein VHF67_03710 [Gaiellaceae bacterium]|nr:hypothetical protein [Gaiellaceae bacterium]
MSEIDEPQEQEWTDPREREGWDPLAGGGGDPEDVDVEENLEEAREGEDDAPPL